MFAKIIACIVLFVPYISSPLPCNVEYSFFFYLCTKATPLYIFYVDDFLISGFRLQNFNLIYGVIYRLIYIVRTIATIFMVQNSFPRFMRTIIGMNYRKHLL